MAPIRKITKRSSGPTSYPTPTAAFSTTKKDKQAIKHSILLSKVSKSAPKSQTKRRRPNKKLVATLESLADALPDYDGEDGEAGVKEVGQARVVKRSGEASKSLGSGRGLAKRKAKIEKVERERMGLNLAAMATATSTASAEGGGSGGVQDRWAALRRHVESNMEKKKEFVAG